MSSLPIPDEGIYYDIERDLMDNEPPGLFPEDQNSYWGQVRHVFAEHLQLNIADPLAQWYINLDPRTVITQDMPEWEEMLGIPEIPHDYVTGVPDSYRRALILTRYEKGPFTRARRDRVIESFISATFGVALSFGVDGILMDAAGRPLYADTIALKSSYRVYEDVANFAYQVQILNTITPDTATMLRELKRITPAPTSANVTINNSVTDVLDYGLAARNTQPVAHYRLAGNANDSSAYANHGTLNGAPASVGSPGLLHALSAGGGCYDFDGVDDHIVIPAAPQNALRGTYSLSAWVNLDAQAAAGHYRPILANNGSTVYIALAANGVLVTSSWLDGVQKTASAPTPLATGTTYFIVARYTGKALELFVNGAKVASLPYTGVATTSSTWSIGAAFGDWFDGKVDEVKIHNYDLSDAQIAELYNQGKGLA